MTMICKEIFVLMKINATTGAERGGFPLETVEIKCAGWRNLPRPAQ